MNWLRRHFWLICFNVITISVPISVLVHACGRAQQPTPAERTREHAAALCDEGEPWELCLDRLVRIAPIVRATPSWETSTSIIVTSSSVPEM